MADTKITGLTNFDSSNTPYWPPAPASDVIPIVDVSDTTMAGSGTTKKISINNLLSSSPTASGALTVTGLVTAGSATITGNLTVDTSTFFVDSSADKVGIGTTSLSGEKLTVAGNLSANAWLGRSNIAVPTGDCSIFRSADNTLGFGIASTTAMTLNSTGLAVANGNVILSTSGTGIDFSATASGSGTMTSELLADYEEGTWVPGVSFGGGVTGIVYSENSGKYTKIGRQVTVSAFIDFSNKGSSTGNVLITGLPFTIGAANSNYTAASLVIVRITFADYPMAFGTPNATSLEVQEVTNAGVRTNLTDADFANNSQIILSFTYTV